MSSYHVITQNCYSIIDYMLYIATLELNIITGSLYLQVLLLFPTLPTSPLATTGFSLHLQFCFYFVIFVDFFFRFNI